MLWCTYVMSRVVRADVWMVLLQARSNNDKSECVDGSTCQCPCYTPTDYNYCSGHFTITELVYSQQLYDTLAGIYAMFTLRASTRVDVRRRETTRVDVNARCRCNRTC